MINVLILVIAVLASPFAPRLTLLLLGAYVVEVAIRR